jgi:phosphoserine phosphatase RsbU/P
MSPGESRMQATAVPDRHRLNAFEIWGGNDRTCDRLSVPGFDMQVLCRPYEGREGGDLRFVSTCAMGNIVRFTLADIAGHGKGVAGTALHLRDMIRKHINKPNPTKFARALNHEFARLQKDGIFATAIICTYFAPTDHLIVCNAGHPRPLFYRAKSRVWQLLDQDSPGNLAQGDASEVGVGNLPLGIVTETNYPQYAVRLEVGDIVITYTDALIEATDADGRPLGEDGLLALAAQLDTSKPESLDTALAALVDRYCGGKAPSDDISILALYHTGSNPPRMALGERLKVLGRMVGFMK